MSEKWKKIKRFPDYKVSNRGRVRSTNKWIPHWCGGLRLIKGKLLKLIPRKGYLTVGLTDGSGRVKIESVHTLVLEAFVGPCPLGKQCCHWDDIKLNNRLSNLRWGTPKENSKDAQRNGRSGPLGEDHHSSKLTVAEVREIRKVFAKGFTTINALRLEYEVSFPTMKAVVEHRYWKHV